PMGGPPMGGGDDGRSPRRGGGKRRGGGTPTGPNAPGQGAGGGRGKRRDGPGGGAWSEQDLAEREARLQKSGGFLKQRRQQMKRGGGPDNRAQTPAQKGGKVQITEPFTIKDLSAATGVKGAEIVKKLFMQGVMATINSPIEPNIAAEMMIDYDIELEVTEAKTAEQQVSEEFEAREAVDERERGPVVTILGHVDHGKTSLLDKIRNANVAAGEAGGITQATSAFRVPLEIGDEKRVVVFLDTPGHEAFTEMRSRGANMTDIVVLVVAADDGVMPQTKESIAHAKAAGVPIVVALNKIDKPEATDSNIQKILGQLAENELNPTDWGGDTEVVRTSAIKGEGIQELLEILDLQAQVLELKADFGGNARGTVIEARPEEGRGSVANLLLQQGQLKLGDFVVAGRAFGRVRDITNDRGERLKEALPPAPVQISGIDQLPDAGDKFYVVDSLKKAEQAAEQRRNVERETQLAAPKMTTLDSMFSAMAEKQLKEILVVLKADVQGSVDVLKNEIEKVQSDEVRCRVLHSAVGGVTEADVRLAEASSAVIVGFNVIPSGKARQLAEQKGVQIRPYQVIYDIVDDMKAAASGLLAPELRQEVLGHAEVRQVFKVSKVGAIAGCYVTDGTVERDAYIRVTRDDIVIENNRQLEQLKRFKDDVKEVRSGMECGMKIVGYDDIKEGDILECYKQIEVKRSL
ncbi:MAG: translation initiation factor IF-2, partial [Planctomycetota bacterium]